MNTRKPNDFQTKFLQIDELIRLGQVARARTAVTLIKKSQIPRSAVYQWANLQRRVGEVEASLRSLRQVVRPDQGIVAVPTDLENCEYAAGLITVGAFREAYALLDGCNEDTGLAQFYKSLGLIREYRFQEAVQELKSVIEQSTLEEYRSLTAQVNLISCFIALDLLSEADTWIRKVEDQLAETDFQLLKGNLLELKGQRQFASGNFEDSEEFLKNSSLTLGEANSIHTLSVEKWKILSRAYRGKATDENFARLRELARQNENWDLLREADFHEGISKRDTNLLSRVYYGTPFLNYRNKLLQFSKDFFEVPDQFSYADSPKTFSATPFNLLSCTFADVDSSVTRGQKLHMFLVKLLSDFYRPSLNGAIFDFLYPGEFFDPLIAKRRIANIYIRIREFFKEQLPSWQLVESEKSYRILPGSDVAVQIEKPLLTFRYEGPDQFELYYFQIRSGKKSFHKQDLKDHNHLKETQVKEVLQWGVQNERLQKTTNGRQVLYSLIETDK